MNNSSLSIIGDFAGIITAGLAIVISIWTFVSGTRKERKKTTLDALRYIRLKYYNWCDLSEKEKVQYLNELEYFATGISSKVFDYKIVKMTSGNRLVKQYDMWIFNYIHSGKGYKTINVYPEYEKLINKIKQQLS